MEIERRLMVAINGKQDKLWEREDWNPTGSNNIEFYSNWHKCTRNGTTNWKDKGAKFFWCLRCLNDKICCLFLVSIYIALTNIKIILFDIVFLNIIWAAEHTIYHNKYANRL